MLPGYLLPSFMRGPRNCTDFHDVQPWDELKTKFDSRLVLSAASYQPFRPFTVEPCQMDETLKVMPKSKCAISPNGGFRYTEVVLAKGTWLDCAQGNRRGNVCFDDDIVIPRINAKCNGEWDDGHPCRSGFRQRPWMSLTPMEILTQRGGLRRAKGHVVVAGLGLGWLLQRVSERKQVKQVTLVEISQELVDWLLPNLNTNGTPINVVVGDARKLVPEMEADVALTDIDMDYGGNTFPRCPKIGHVWTWGTQFCC